MLQWITALDKAKDSSPWVAKNRYDSFAPVRMNVATQWLVDGVRTLLLIFHSFRFDLTCTSLCLARLHVEPFQGACDGTRNNLYS